MANGKAEMDQNSAPSSSHSPLGAAVFSSIQKSPEQFTRTPLARSDLIFTQRCSGSTPLYLLPGGPLYVTRFDDENKTLDGFAHTEAVPFRKLVWAGCCWLLGGCHVLCRPLGTSPLLPMTAALSIPPATSEPPSLCPSQSPIPSPPRGPRGTAQGSQAVVSPRKESLFLLEVRVGRWETQLIFRTELGNSTACGLRTVF